MDNLSKLLEALDDWKYNAVGQKETDDALQSAIDISDEMSHKQNIKPTKELLLSNGFKLLHAAVTLPFETYQLKKDSHFWVDHYVKPDDETGIVNDSWIIRIASHCVNLTSIADFEIAIALCGIEHKFKKV